VLTVVKVSCGRYGSLHSSLLLAGLSAIFMKMFMNVEWEEKWHLLIDVTSEEGARGGSERLVGLNWLPVVIPSWPPPKHGVVKSHRNSGSKGPSVV
jgi:hypothetical protein